MRVFVDTNVLVYARDTGDQAKAEMAGVWLDYLWETKSARTSTQVLNEYFVTVTRKLDPGLSVGAAQADVADLMAWSPCPIDGDLVLAAFQIQDQATVSHWDALVIAAAQRTESSLLLSEDLNDGQAFGPVTVANPFIHSPPSA